MSVNINDLFQVRAIGECFGQRIMLTHHYYVYNVFGAPAESTTTTELLDEIRAAGGGDVWETLLRAVMPIEWNLVRWEAQKIKPVRYVFQSVTRAVAGTHAGTTDTANQSASLCFTTALAGQSQKSIKKIGPIPQGAATQDAGLLTAAYKVLLAALGNGMLQPIVGALGTEWHPCVPHPLPVGSFTELQSFTVEDTIRGMSRRTVGRGI